jgi:HAD superfamily hydrolase (TIGR01450 family)
MKAFLFDLDGCIYFGNTPAEGAAELLQRLKADGGLCFFVTNNSTHRAREIADRMTAMGLPVQAEQVVPVTELAGRYILDRFGKSSVKVIGSESLCAAVAETGHRLIAYDADERPDVVLIGRDVAFTYDKLRRIAAEAVRGAHVLSANPDAHHLGSGGEIVPETGALAAAVEAMIGRTLPYIGKPGPFPFQFIMAQYGLRPQDCVMVGDNPSTDILGGKNAGLRTIWIRDDPLMAQASSGMPEPDLTITRLRELLDVFNRC